MKTLTKIQYLEEMRQSILARLGGKLDAEDYSLVAQYNYVVLQITRLNKVNAMTALYQAIQSIH